MWLDPADIHWHIINDGVMGGLSRSSFELDHQGLHFRGDLSTAHGGGFASIRGALPAPLGDFSGFRLELTGDGRPYQLRLRESDDSAAVAWRAVFDTRTARETITLSIEDFEPVIRGRRIYVLPGLTQRKVCYVGVMLTSKQEGPFALTIHSLETMPLDNQHA